MKEKERYKQGSVSIPELLAPAGNFEKMITAVHYGADAVYMGGKRFSLRAKAGNFSTEKMVEAINYCHDHGVKVYVTANIIAHNEDFVGLSEYLHEVYDAGADGIIISDPGILAVAKETVPGLPVHLSTQANVTNTATAKFWMSQGVSRLNLARELSLKELRNVRDNISGEIEVFVHGALCISYSGRCMLSNYMTGRDANQGNCAHPCRYSYSLVEEKRPGQFFPVEEDERGTYIFNAKDLCLLDSLPMMVASGVDSLKIEGRMKSIFYVGGVVRVYRAALDYLNNLTPKEWSHPEHIRFPVEFKEELLKTGTRGISQNFISGRPGSGDMNYHTSRAEQSHEPVAVIKKGGEIPLVEVRNTLLPGVEAEVMGRGVQVTRFAITAILDEEGRAVPKAHPGNRVYLKTDPVLAGWERNTILRREIQSAS